MQSTRDEQRTSDGQKPSLKDDTKTLRRLLLCGFAPYTKDDESAMTRIHAVLADPLLQALTTISRDDIENATKKIDDPQARAGFNAGAYWFIGRWAGGKPPGQ